MQRLDAYSIEVDKTTKQYLINGSRPRSAIIMSSKNVEYADCFYCLVFIFFQTPEKEVASDSSHSCLGNHCGVWVY